MIRWISNALLLVIGVILGLALSRIVWSETESSSARKQNLTEALAAEVPPKLALRDVADSIALPRVESLSVAQLVTQSAKLPPAKKFRMIAEQIPDFSDQQLKALIVELNRNDSFDDVMELISVAGEPLMRSDVNGFFRWIDAEFDEIERIDLLFEMMKNALPESVGAIWEALRSVWPPEESEMMISHLMAHAAEVDPQATLQTSLGLFSDESLKFEAVMAVLDTWVQTDPKSAVAAVLTMPESNQSDLFRASVLDGWYAENPEEMELMLQQGGLSEEIRKKGIAVAVHAKAGVDPLAAAEWLAKFPQDTISGETVVNLTTHLALQHPEAALEWNSRIQDKALKSINQFDIVTRWAVSDLTAAMEFASQNPIEDEALEQEFWQRFSNSN